ncbi:MAG: extracellular solute-binding protein [Ignavibacteriae bacterium]|nr:MAG: extracellular solute-binding protein [Ignavibacteriota bacterium]
MRKRYVIASALIIVLIIIGIGWYPTLFDYFKIGAKNQPVKLYYADNISPSHDFAIQEFNRLHKGKIEVVPVNLPFSKFSTNERKELLTRSLRSKSEKLDIFAVDLIWVPRFAKWCEPLDSYFTQQEKERILGDAMRSCMYDGTLVSMPMYLDVGLMYYRWDIIRRLPDAALIEKRLQESITWDEMIRLRERLGYKKKPFFIFPAKDFEGLVCTFLELSVGQQPDFLKSNSFPILTPTAKKSLQMMVDFVKNGTTPPEVVDFDEFLCNTYMLDHDAVFVLSWEDFVQSFRTSYHDTTKLKYVAIAPLPHFEGKSSASVIGGWNFMVSKSSTKKAEAMEFIRFFQSEEIQRLIFERTGYLPAISSVYQDSLFLKNHQELNFLHQLLRRGFHRPALVDYTKVSDIVSHFANLAIKREISVEEALARTDEQIRSNEVIIK